MRNRIKPIYIVTLVHFDAGHDTNGNPRRTFVGFSPFGDIAGTWREGYYGTAAVPESLRELATRAVRVRTMPRELEELARNVHPDFQGAAPSLFRDASAELRRRILKRGKLRGF